MGVCGGNFRIPLGPVAQLGERLVCIQEVVGSIPVGSTTISQESTESIAARRVPSRKRGISKVLGNQTKGPIAQSG